MKNSVNMYKYVLHQRLYESSVSHSGIQCETSGQYQNLVG